MPSLLATQLRGREEMAMAPGQLLKEPKQQGNGVFIEDLIFPSPQIGIHKESRFSIRR